MKEREVSLGDAIKLTLERKLASNRRPAYVLSLKNYLNMFARGRESLSVNSITTADIEDWFDRRNEPASSRASNLGRLSAMFSLCWRRGFIETNPCDRVERIIIDRAVPEILTVHQSWLVLRATQNLIPCALAYVVLCLFAGVRPSEAQKITRAQVDLPRGILRIDAAASKIRRRRVVCLRPAAVEWLSACEVIEPLTIYTVRKWRRIAATSLGLKQWSHDVMRHSAASYWLADVRDVGKVATELGNSPAILMRHYHELVSPEEAKAFWSLRPTRAEQLQLNL